MSDHEPGAAARIRNEVDHPVIDSDGHLIEFLPAVMDHLEAIAGRSAVERFSQWMKEHFAPTPERQRDERIQKLPFWTLPTRNTRDRATAGLPALLHERMEELGFDYCVLFPTMGLVANEVEDDELRPALCRAFNRYSAEMLSDFSFRMTGAAVIPMFTPAEAISELDYAVGELGMKVVMPNTYVRRPIPAAERLGAGRLAQWHDTYGLDSAFDYDPFWQRCLDLGVSPTFHTGTLGVGTRRSLTSYVHNHLGHFAAASEATCRSLLLGGVTHRFPDLRFAFLEGGAAWGCRLFADLVDHFEKRNRRALEDCNPAHVDRALFESLFSSYAGDALLERMSGPAFDDPQVATGALGEEELDEWRLCGVERAEDLKARFVERFYFGCEADDALTPWAYASSLNPFGSRLRTLLGSDIGHFDVPDMTWVLPEAWEPVESGEITREDFRDFVFANPASFWTSTNPEFFRGTAIEDSVEALHARP
jgi:predicted TIM-barrel fold metal-dependent hydrolase